MSGIVDVLLQLTVEGLTTKSGSGAVDHDDPGIPSPSAADEPGWEVVPSLGVVPRLEPLPS